MRYQVIALFLIASLCSAQTPIAVPQVGTNAPPQAPLTSVASTRAIFVPPGTTIPMTLVSPIMSKSTNLGASVRAVVAFPVTVGTQIAIPAGTFVTGTVNSLTARAPHTNLPAVQIHFTQLLFANGYSVALNAANTAAMVTIPSADPQIVCELADARDGAPFLGEGFGAPGQTSPEPPPLQPLPRLGPNPAVIGGAIGGGGLLLMILAFVWGHHNAKNADYVLYDNGWQFQMVLDSPLTLDAGKVAAAAAMPAAQ